MDSHLLGLMSFLSSIRFGREFCGRQPLPSSVGKVSVCPDSGGLAQGAGARVGSLSLGSQ